MGLRYFNRLWQIVVICMRHWWQMKSTAMCLLLNTTISIATSFRKPIAKTLWGMTLGCTTIKINTKNPPKICFRHPDMNSINIFRPSRISFKMARKNQIGLKLEPKPSLEVWWNMTWARLFHSLPTKKYSGEESQKNCFGLSRARLMLASYKTKESTFGQATAQNSTWKALV